MSRVGINQRISKWIITSLFAGFFSVLPFASVPAQAWTSPSVSAVVIGGPGNEAAVATAVDGAGNIYTTGTFTSTVDFDPGPGVTNLTSMGGTDVFVAKFDSLANLIWAKQLGGASNDTVSDIGVDGQGNVITAGTYMSTAYFNPATTASDTLTGFASTTSIFVSKLNTAGDFVWVDGFGNAGANPGVSKIAVDTSTGTIYTIGGFQGTMDINPGPGVANVNGVYNYDFFLQKLDSAGAYQWAVTLGSGGNEGAYGVSVDGSGNVVVAGSIAAASTVNFNPKGTAQNLVKAAGYGFTAKYNSSGILSWVKQAVGVANKLILDQAGNVYTVGYFNGTLDFDPDTDTVNLVSSAGTGFILKQNSSGQFAWVRQITGIANNAFVDRTSIYTTGYFSGSGDFDPGLETTTMTSAGGYDVFIVKLSDSGNFSWAKRYGGSADDRGNAIAITANSTLFTFGNFTGVTNLGPSPCVMNFTVNGGPDLFLLASDLNGNQFPIAPPTYDTLTVLSGFSSGGAVTRFNGTNLWCTISATVGGTAAAYSVISDTSVSITTPAGTDGLKSIVLSTPYGAAASPTIFNYIGRYKVTYDKNTATGTQVSETYTVGTPLTLPVTTTFTKTGFTFGGWGTTPDTTTAVTTYSTSAPITFYAIWTPNPYVVTFNANRAGATGSMASETHTAPTALPLNTFAAAGRTFRFWNTQANGGGTKYDNGAQYAYIANTTLYAQWGVSVSYSSLGADSGSPTRTLDLVDTSTLTLPTAGTMVKAGYTFGGWSNGVTTYTTSYTPSANITLNPVWTPKTYTVSFNKNGVTRSGAVPGNQTWAESTTPLTLSGNTGNLVRDGYTFGGWATTASAPQTAITTYSTTSETLTQTLYAVWTPIMYSVTYLLNNGDGTAPTQSSLKTNETFTVAARPTRSGYQFADWFDGKSGYDANATYRIETSTVTLTARWVPVYTLHYILNGSLDTPETDTTAVGGTVLQLAAAPTRIGYSFNGWRGRTNVLLAAGDPFTLVEDSNMVAQWTAISRTVTYNTVGASTETPTQSSLIFGDYFAIAAEPSRAGYRFAGWSDGTDVFGAGARYDIALANVVLTAQWTAIAYTVTYDLGGGYLATPPTKSDVNIGNTFNLYNGTDPALLAHTFIGWSDGARTYAKNAVYTAGARNILLTAQYSLNGYTRITYAVGSGGSGTPPAVVSQLEGTTFSVESASALSRSGYAFNGWSDGTYTYQPGDTFYVGPVSTPVTLTAQWIVGYGVTYLPGTGTGSVPTDSNSYLTNGTFNLLDATQLSQSGYTFAGWSDGSATYQPGYLYTVASAAITFTAQWNLIPPTSNNTVVVRTTPKKEEADETLNRKSPTSMLIVATQVAIASDKSAAKKLFSEVSKPVVASSQSAPKASQIQSVGDGKTINAVVAQITTASKAVISLPATNVVLSDFVVEKLAQQATVTATDAGITVTPVGGYTGVLIVPTAATINGEVVIVLNKVVVNPVPPVGIGFAPVDFNKSSISWAPSTSQVTSYKIAINGKTACETTLSSCPVPALIGPKSKVTITALGNDQTVSRTEVIPYAATAPIPALRINFATGSSVLSKAQKTEIIAISKVVDKQGFTRLVVDGFTDSRGSVELNAKLSQARAIAVANFMKPLLPSVKVKASAFGIKNPIASNADPDGQAQNRRTEISTW